ncbi:MAG: HK97 family phage prohead protease [Bacteroidales bacterium]|nr:HK97 family phage prohead protease [Bacteroidales bacterium]
MTIILCDSNSVNSYGFRTMVGGINLERFKANPVMLYQHDTERILGHWENIRVEDGKLMADPAFDTDDEEMKPIIGKIERGHLKGCSVGMRVLRFETTPTGEMLAAESELMEASIVTIPSDANALVLYNPDDDRHALSVEEFKKLYINMEQNETVNTDNSAVIARLQAQNEEKDRVILELQAQVAQMEATQIDTMLNTAVAEGRIGKDEVQLWATLAALDYATVQKVLEMRAKSGETRVERGERTSLQAMVKGDKGEDIPDWDLCDKNGTLYAIKQKQPEVYAKMYAKKFGK